MRIVRLTSADIHLLVPLAKQYTGIIPDMPFDEQHWVSCLKDMADSGIGVFYAALDDDGNAVAAIGGIKYPCLLTGRMTAVELFWYADENSRGRHGIRLFHMFEEWAKDEGCQRIAMIYLPCSMPEKLHRYYEHSGYTLREMHFEKGL